MTQRISWAQVASRLLNARSYWLATSRPNGDPHVAPVWGAVVDSHLFLYSERWTIKARNVAARSSVAVHLENAEDVVIVHGRLEDLGHPARRPDVLAALDSKYADPSDAAYLPTADPQFDVLWVLRPTTALLWKLADFEGSQQRWSSDDGLS